MTASTGDIQRMIGQFEAKIESLTDRLEELEERCKERDSNLESKITDAKRAFEERIASTDKRVTGVEDELSLYKKYRWIGTGAVGTGIIITAGWKTAREKLLDWIFR